MPASTFPGAGGVGGFFTVVSAGLVRSPTALELGSSPEAELSTEAGGRTADDTPLPGAGGVLAGAEGAGAAEAEAGGAAGLEIAAAAGMLATPPQGSQQETAVAAVSISPLRRYDDGKRYVVGETTG
ncbi:MAG: hypothetical protein U0835_17345 [Isosphaeraceae bacterium]